MPEPNTEDAVVIEDDDPRPVFEGVWASASGVEKGEHSERVRLWKLRHPEHAGQRGDATAPGAQSRMAEPSGEPERHADDLRALQHIIDTAPILSDRTRAIEAKQRILGKVEAEERGREHGPLIDLRAALDALPPEARVDALGALLVVVEE